MWHKMCDLQTELEMAVNAWVAFATKNISNIKHQQWLNQYKLTETELQRLGGLFVLITGFVTGLNNHFGYRIVEQM